MVLIMPLVSVAVSIFYTPFLLLILCIIFLASIGKSLGVRRLYVNILLKLFEYGRQHIEVAKKVGRSDSSDDEEEPPVPDDKPPSAAIKENGTNGSSKTTVIERAEILGPSPDLNYKRSGSQERGKNGHKQESNTEFHISHCLDLVKAGMESIIEDQVTSVFEAEELRSWNLLTRTNRQYEFLTWRLTIIWAMGFVVRYFFLFPLRILIFIIGTLTMVITNSIVSFIPFRPVRRFFGKVAYKMSFRVIMRSLSLVTTFHDHQYMPKANGFCVANHTTPLDVAILSIENCYSLVWWLVISTACIGTLPEGSFKKRFNFAVSVMCFNFLSRSISAVITYHDERWRPKEAGICAANHTSPIDALVLMCDNCYSLIGQSHGGFLGLLQRALARASPHIWFERSEVKDRHAVARRLKEHISVPDNPPILIFPEGTCINNTSVLQFKKGSFEVGGTVYPVAIKYDPRFGDAFWNSSRYGYLHYLMNMMSSWAIVCEVWYLPPMCRHESESAVDFANRVKSAIARRGGLVDLMWDGQLKRMKAKKEWREMQQEEFSKRLKGE